MKLTEGWYIGEIDLELRRSGFGSMSYKTGAYYDGSWVRDRMEGVGKMLYANGNLYEGHFRGGKRHGFGKLVYAGSKGYILGNWKADKLEGHIERYDKGKGFFSGNYVNGRKHGEGTMRKKNLEYKGEYYNGLKHGVFTFSTLKGTKKLLVMYDRGVKKKVKVVKCPNFAKNFPYDNYLDQLTKIKSKKNFFKSTNKLKTPMNLAAPSNISAAPSSQKSSQIEEDSIFSFKIEKRQWRAYSEVLNRSNTILKHPALASKKIDDIGGYKRIGYPSRFSTCDSRRFLIDSADLNGSGSKLSFG